MPDEKNVLGGLSVQRRELLSHIRAEEDDPWEELVYHDSTVRTHFVGRICPLMCSYSRMNLTRLSNRCSQRRNKSCRYLITCRCLFGGRHNTKPAIEDYTPRPHCPCCPWGTFLSAVTSVVSAIWAVYSKSGNVPHERRSMGHCCFEAGVPIHLRRQCI